MNLISAIRSTARITDFLFRNAWPLYAAMYDTYKRVSERTDIALIRSLVAPGDRVVDVGANIGFYAALLADCVGHRGAVYAFEPDPTNFQKLLLRSTSYPQIHPVQAAVTTTDGTVDLHLSPDLNIDHRTYPSDEGRKTLKVPAVSLDSFFGTSQEPLQFIKMDVQGAEYSAILGMRELVTRSPDLQILMELWPFVHDRYGAGTKALLALLDSWGFEVRRVRNAGTGPGEKLTPDSRIPEQDDPDGQFDVLCSRPRISYR